MYLSQFKKIRIRLNTKIFILPYKFNNFKLVNKWEPA